MITFAQEQWSASIKELEPVLRAHFAEVQEDLELDVDWELYAKYAELGMLNLFVVRLFGEIKGYHISFILPAPHYKSTKFSISDSFWLSPELRGVGLGAKLFTELEAQLKSLGVQRVLQNTRAQFPIPFDRLGYKEAGKTYSKDL